MRDFHEYLESFFNPDTRQKVGYDKRNELLVKYAGDPTVFVSFTSIPKLGINPQSSYDTPIGIYAYPVDYVLSKFDRHAAEFNVPFAGDEPYAQVFRAKNPNKLLVLNKGDSHIVNSFESLLDMESERAKEDQLSHKKWRALSNLFNQLPKDMAQKADAVLSLPNIMGLNSKLIKLWSALGYDNVQVSKGGFGSTHYVGPDPAAPPGIVSIMDKIHKTLLHYQEKEKNNYLLLKSNRLNHVLKKIRKFPFEDRLKQLYGNKKTGSVGFSGGVMGDWKNEKIRIVKDWVEKSECDKSFAWFMSRTVADENPKKWNWVLRSLGIDGVVDHGTGTIHRNEPIQAWFAGLDVVQHLTTLDNKQKTNTHHATDVRHGMFINFGKNVKSSMRSDDNPLQFYVLQKFHKGVLELRTLMNNLLWNPSYLRDDRVDNISGLLNVIVKALALINKIGAEVEKLYIDTLVKILDSIDHRRGDILGATQISPALVRQTRQLALAANTTDQVISLYGGNMGWHDPHTSGIHVGTKVKVIYGYMMGVKGIVVDIRGETVDLQHAITSDGQSIPTKITVNARCLMPID